MHGETMKIIVKLFTSSCYIFLLIYIWCTVTLTSNLSQHWLKSETLWRILLWNLY